MTSIGDSSEPFRAFLGAILSVVKGVAVQPSPAAFNPDMELDSVIEEDKVEHEDPSILLKLDIDAGPGAYPGSSSSGTATDHLLTRRRKRTRD
jgi:hypothetical protein